MTPLSCANCAALAQRLADLLERLLLGHFFRQPVRPDLDARRAEVLRQLHPLLRLVDVLAHDRRVGRVVLAGGAQAADLHRRVLEPLAHLGPRRRRQRDLHAVLVGGPQLDGVEARVGEILDDGRHVPVLGDVVGDGAELEALARRRRQDAESGRSVATPSAGTAATVERKSRRFMRESLQSTRQLPTPNSQRYPNSSDPERQNRGPDKRFARASPRSLERLRFGRLGVGAIGSSTALSA